MEQRIGKCLAEGAVGKISRICKAIATVNPARAEAKARSSNSVYFSNFKKVSYLI
ncbi:hypothetical protein COO91_00952 [Nostoc flagelliforme CCNUN1]|uniref:Uncharacterized protein n=1 Tax=Nostoc flagelliforme CCNUN1 TaxID=2038116 RepID=A0A2K8SI42_9NOSO|nr:hypothetical protein COO91_00952 [Nostoc flagelliforme CCNUN1]